LVDSTTYGNGTAKKSNRLLSKEQLIEDLNRSPYYSAKGPRKKSSTKIKVAMTPNASLIKEAKKNMSAA